MQMTYRELGDLISLMTDSQKDKPVKMYIGETGELYPQDQSQHPDYGFSSRLAGGQEMIDGEYFPGDEFNPDQFVILEYMDEEGSEACRQLHEERVKSGYYKAKDKKINSSIE